MQKPLQLASFSSKFSVNILEFLIYFFLTPGVVDFFPNLHPLGQILPFDINAAQPNTREFQ